jgi:hypothetical protein
MGWLIRVLMALGYGYQGFEQSKRAGTWSWSKFVFSIGFALLEGALLSAPLLLMNANNPYFVPVYVAAWVAAAALFVWFIIVARRWKLPDGRTALEADRQEKGKG